MRLRFLPIAGIALTLTACATGTSITSGPVTTEPQTAAPAPVRAVRLDTGAGSVTVTGTPGASGATVNRVVHNQTGNPVGETTTVAGGELTLHGCGDRCAVDYTVTVPVGTPVTGSTSEGRIALRGVANVDVGSTNGAIDLADIARGPLSVRSVNGEIHGTGLRTAGVRAQTTNGGIDLTVTGQQDITAQTTNGRLALTVPQGSYRVRTSTENGSTDVGVRDDPGARYGLDLRTTNGTIAVRTA